MIDLTVLDVNQLEPNPFQPREQIKREDIFELMESIKQQGILEPLVVAQTPVGYQIIAGERRWRAAKYLGLKTVPVKIHQTTPRGMLEMALVENVQRENLNPMERAQAFKRLKVEFGLSDSKIAEKIGKSVPFISNTLRLLKLPDAVKDGLLGNMITEGHARALSGLDDDELIVECYKTIMKQSASVRRTEEMVRNIKNHKAMNLSDLDGVARNQNTMITKAQLKSWHQLIQPLFHADTQLDVTRSSRQTKITLILKGGLEATQDDLKKFIEQLTAESRKLSE